MNKRAKIPKYQQFEQEVVRWIDSYCGLFATLHFGLGMRMIQHYARNLAREMNYHDFNPESGGWFGRFCQRQLVNRRTLHGSGGDVNIAYEETAIQKLKMDLSAFEARDIYNIDETGLFYR